MTEEFLKAWNARPWLTEDESDKERAWRWWQAALTSQSDRQRHNLPFHQETVDGLNALTIRKPA